MVENQERVQAMGRLVNTPRGALGESPDKPDMNQIQKQLETALAAQIGKHTVSVTPTKEGIVVSLREMGFFDSGSTSLRPEAEPTLADFVSVVGPRRVRVRIEGHTDNVPIHNTICVQLGAFDVPGDGDHKTLNYEVWGRFTAPVSVRILRVLSRSVECNPGRTSNEPKS
jgi:hypothetical protein